MQTLAAVAAEAIIELKRLAAEGRPPRDRLTLPPAALRPFKADPRPAQYLDAA
ncbi:hypothetical protein M8494_19850 [Serratia ureilytica]